MPPLCAATAGAAVFGPTPTPTSAPGFVFSAPLPNAVPLARRFLSFPAPVLKLPATVLYMQTMGSSVSGLITSAATLGPLAVLPLAFTVLQPGLTL
jgi:hypothetical protein